MAQKLTQEEIARQFQLPERKSKLAYLLKDETCLDCLCGSQDSSTFIVSCGYCGRKYHGSCVGLIESDFNNTERYLCPLCQVDEELPLKTKKSHKKSNKSKSKKPSNKRTSAKADPEYDASKKCDNKDLSCNNWLQKPSPSHSVCKTSKSTKKSTSKKKDKSDNIRDDKTISQSENEEEYSNDLQGDGRHCYGPGCTKSARLNSKYCSDKCGMKLATNRILQILPLRLQEWSMNSTVAEKSDIKALEKVRQKQAEVQSQLLKLDLKIKKLETIISYGKTLEPDPLDNEQLKKMGKKKSCFFQNEKDDSSVYCVTCGQEIHTISAVKHMEKCFIKYESQSSFGSMYQTMVQGNVFCDFFSPSSKTYCKRLRVLCPEHTKEPVVREDEACGCPLVKDVFEETTEFCRIPKWACSMHYSWEKIRRAEADLQKVQYWVKMDELIQEEAQIRKRMFQRAGVLPLLLHSTYDHDAQEEMTLAQEEERLAHLEKTLRENYDKEQFEKISKEHKQFMDSVKASIKP